MSAIFPPVFSLSNTYFLTWIFFAIEIKKCACTRSKELFLIESFPAWRTDLKFPYDVNTPRNTAFKYIFYIRSCWKQNINGSCQILQTKKAFYFEIIKYILWSCSKNSYSVPVLKIIRKLNEGSFKRYVTLFLARIWLSPPPHPLLIENTCNNSSIYQKDVLTHNRCDFTAILRMYIVLTLPTFAEKFMTIQIIQT